MNKPIQITIRDNWQPFKADLRRFVNCVQKELTPDHDEEENLLPYHDKLIQPLCNPLSTAELEVHFLKHIIVDLVGHGWSVLLRKDVLKITRKDEEHASTLHEKEYVRQRHLRERNAQLLEPSVRKFIEKIECRTLNKKGWHSIFSLMRDGRELAGVLHKVRKIVDSEARQDALSSAIQPYLQFVERDEICEHTDLPLMDIWRYFRHTWVTTYKTLPGRSMSILVRDGAAPNHPVIGIAALGSSIVQQKIRDLWIGWEPEAITSNLITTAGVKDVRWLLDALDQQISHIYIKDLIAEKVLSTRRLKRPNEELIAMLRGISSEAKKAHQLYPKATDIKKTVESSVAWEILAKTNLYKSKRASVLADLLSARLIFSEWKLEKADAKGIREALRDRRVRQAITGLLRKIKAEHVGIDMMDIIICGAVPPYNYLLGGKLVCTLLASPEVTKYYNDRYGSQQSVIASSMRGAPVVRSPQLVLLGTTSLYGVGSSQYNRIKIPVEMAGGKETEYIAYEELGKSVGFGSFQFSSATLGVMEVLLSRSTKGKKVNSIFGEGVNPLMRKIRDALQIVGLPQDEVLKHKRSRIIYGVPLARNFREVLAGKQKRPKYKIPQTKPVERTRSLAEYWRTRWLSKRIDRADVLQAVSQNSLEYPVRHEARVTLYRLKAAKDENYEMEFEVDHV